MDAKERAIRYLNARMCSCEQMRRYLKGKGYEAEEIDPVIDELVQYGFLDDRRYASAYIEDGYEKGRGINRIRRELAQKGVSREDVAFAEESIEDAPDEFETALKLAENIVQGVDMDRMEWKEKEALKGRIARRLAGKGFSSEVIYRVIGRII